MLTTHWSILQLSAVGLSIFSSHVCMVGLIGLVLFSVAAKKYKYRERDEVTFRQIVVEESDSMIVTSLRLRATTEHRYSYPIFN